MNTEKKTQKILVVVDMQNDFISGALGNDDCRAAVDGCKKLCESGEFDTIIFTRDTHHGDYDLTLEGKKLPVKHCIEHTHGWEIIPELIDFACDKKNAIVNKFTFGSYKNLIDIIEWCRRGLDLELHFCGVCTSICVLSNMTIARAVYPNNRIVLHKNATGDVTEEQKQAAFVCAKSIQCDVED